VLADLGCLSLALYVEVIKNNKFTIDLLVLFRYLVNQRLFGFSKEFFRIRFLFQIFPLFLVNELFQSIYLLSQVTILSYKLVLKLFVLFCIFSYLARCFLHVIL
jgi:hypothetical protein